MLQYFLDVPSTGTFKVKSRYLLAQFFVKPFHSSIQCFVVVFFVFVFLLVCIVSEIIGGAQLFAEMGRLLDKVKGPQSSCCTLADELMLTKHHIGIQV